jgi:hypothetical protein
MSLSQNTTNDVKIEELISVFHDIETKIGTLHQNSSQVFLNLNEFLKDYFKKNSIVSANATQIFDTILGNKEISLTEELNHIFGSLQKYKTATENEIDANLVTYTQINSKINYVSLLIRNFKQDLITFKFLTTNFRLISNNESFKSTSLESIKNWDNALVNIQSWLTEIGKEAGSLSFSVNSMHNNTKVYSQNAINKSFSFYKELESAIEIVNRKNLESESYIPVLKEKINNSAGNISDIIKHLQYHDIIRQKVEHIQHSHFKIIASLNKEMPASDLNAEMENEKLFSLIADISGLQAAQLILITKEYQKALEVISANFQNMTDDLSAISTISHEFSFEDGNSETTLIRHVQERLDRSLRLLDEYNSNALNEELLSLKQQITALHKNTEQKIVIPLEKLDSLQNIKQVAGKNSEKDEEGNLLITTQIISLARDIIQKKEDLINEMSNIARLSEKFLAESEIEGFRSILEKEQIRIMVHISKTLESLDTESRQLDEVLLQNWNIRKDIINRLKDTIIQADYYEQFEKVLSVIIEQLNTLNSRLIKDTSVRDKSDKVKNLKEIENYYTVASERIIHQKVINEDKEINVAEKTDSEEDMELF